MKTKLNDLQLILLSNASHAESGSVFPLPASVTDRDRGEKELKTLLRRSLVAEAETTNLAESWRQDGDLHFGLFITAQGKAAIGLGDDGGPGAADTTGVAPKVVPERKPRADSKIANVLALLHRPQGATLAELVEATGWLPHTTRAALTGLKKKGHVVAKSKRDETTCYHIAGGN